MSYRQDRSKSYLSSRWAQMSKQEQLIERKKMEIQAKLEAQKQAAALAESAKAKEKGTKKSDDKGTLNIFNNDGSFMNQFKELLKQQNQEHEKEREKERKIEDEIPSETETGRHHEEKRYKERRDRRKNRSRSRWGENRRDRSNSPPPRHHQFSRIPSLLELPMGSRNQYNEDICQDAPPMMNQAKNYPQMYGPGPAFGDYGPDMLADEPRHMPPGLHNMGPGGPNMQPRNLNMPPNGPNMPPGGPNMLLGGPNMPPGGPNMPLGPNMPPNGPNMSLGRPNMPPGGPNMPPGGPNMPAGGPNMPPSGPNMPPGGTSMPPGGPNMHPGGPNMPPGGPNMSQGVPHLPPGGPSMPPVGLNMTPGGPNMPPGAANMSPGGPNIPLGLKMPPGGLNIHPGGPNMPSGLNIPPGVPNMPPGMQFPPNMPPGMHMPPFPPGGFNMPPFPPGPMPPMPPGMSNTTDQNDDYENNDSNDSYNDSKSDSKANCTQNFPLRNYVGNNANKGNNFGPFPNMHPLNQNMPQFKNGGPNMPPGGPNMPPGGPNMPPGGLNTPPGFMMPPFPPNFGQQSKIKEENRKDDESESNFGKCDFNGPMPFGPPPPGMPFAPPNMNSVPKSEPLDSVKMQPQELMKVQISIDATDRGKIPKMQVLSSDAKKAPPEVEGAAREVATNGPHWENVLRSMPNQQLWFLRNPNSPEYAMYRSLVIKYVNEGMNNTGGSGSKDEKYEPEFSLEEDEYDSRQRSKSSNSNWNNENRDDRNTDRENRKRKRKSRWGDPSEQESLPPPQVAQTPVNPPVLGAGMPPIPAAKDIKLTSVTKSNPALLQYAMMNYGSTNLSPEDWKKCEDNFKLNLLYQDMMNKKKEVEKLAAAGRNKYEYDSDEDTENGTWEHKLRAKEMNATERWADELTRQAAGKHHIGDFLPPEELNKFMEKYSARKSGKEPDLSDYKEYKLTEENKGFKMLQKLGWNEGSGLGADGSGIVNPVNKAVSRDPTAGLGNMNVGEVSAEDDEFEAYRKRMMLAYRFRPNPLNNPRRPYY